ncbi:MAG: hypothetical protein KKH61_21400 [Gammaproteobacteria bacterium]|uniref:Uncharacterized protein n=3 Tax=viral metagenome TaxID=1070528 RepID=A0A6H1ZBL7_9ZZZZ|nr:hypothetical protein [Gammaproteobacteria bacterium]
MIDLFFRCFTRERWIAVATSRGIYDAKGNVNPGFAVDEVGNVMLTPPVMKDDVVVTPAVMDTWFCVNLRIYGPKHDDDMDDLYQGEEGDWKFLRSKLAKFVRNQSTTIRLQGRRAYQFGTGVNRVQLLDPRDITTPVRVWAGGMNL